MVKKRTPANRGSGAGRTASRVEADALVDMLQVLGNDAAAGRARLDPPRAIARALRRRHLDIGAGADMAAARGTWMNDDG